MWRETPLHDCRRNWDRSSKAMEGDIAVQLHKQSSQEGLYYKGVIGDEDSSSIKQIHDHHDADVSKYSDISHIKRTVYGKLEALQKKSKISNSTGSSRLCEDFHICRTPEQRQVSDRHVKGITKHYSSYVWRA